MKSIASLSRFSYPGRCSGISCLESLQQLRVFPPSGRKDPAMTCRTRLLALLVTTTVLLPALLTAAPSPLDKFIGEDALAKITAALPAAATVKPAQPRKVL